MESISFWRIGRQVGPASAPQAPAGEQKPRKAWANNGAPMGPFSFLDFLTACQHPIHPSLGHIWEHNFEPFQHSQVLIVYNASPRNF